MTVLHLVTHGPTGTYPKTLCGTKLANGIHRVAPQHLTTHLERGDRTACEPCTRPADRLF